MPKQQNPLVEIHNNIHSFLMAPLKAMETMFAGGQITGYTIVEPSSGAFTSANVAGEIIYPQTRNSDPKTIRYPTGFDTLYTTGIDIGDSKWYGGSQGDVLAGTKNHYVQVIKETFDTPPYIKVWTREPAKWTAIGSIWKVGASGQSLPDYTTQAVQEIEESMGTQSIDTAMDISKEAWSPGDSLFPEFAEFENKTTQDIDFEYKIGYYTGGQNVELTWVDQPTQRIEPRKKIRVELGVLSDDGLALVALPKGTNVEVLKTASQIAVETQQAQQAAQQAQQQAQQAAQQAQQQADQQAQQAQLIASPATSPSDLATRINAGNISSELIQETLKQPDMINNLDQAQLDLIPASDMIAVLEDPAVLDSLTFNAQDLLERRDDLGFFAVPANIGVSQSEYLAMLDELNIGELSGSVLAGLNANNVIDPTTPILTGLDTSVPHGNGFLDETGEFSALFSYFGNNLVSANPETHPDGDYTNKSGYSATLDTTISGEFVVIASDNYSPGQVLSTAVVVTKRGDKHEVDFHCQGKNGTQPGVAKLYPGVYMCVYRRNGIPALPYANPPKGFAKVSGSKLTDNRDLPVVAIFGKKGTFKQDNVSGKAFTLPTSGLPPIGISSILFIFNGVINEITKAIKQEICKQWVPGGPVVCKIISTVVGVLGAAGSLAKKVTKRFKVKW